MHNVQSEKEYLRRIHKVQDYIEENICETLTLDELSGIAGFSKYHFHRIFKGIVKESLLQYVNRIKLEKALSFIIYRSDMSITDIAYQYCFTDTAIFSRLFKNYYQVSPTYFRKHYRKNCKDLIDNSLYNHSSIKFPQGDNQHRVKCYVSIETIEEMHVAYVRHLGTYENLKIVFASQIKRLFDHLNEHDLIKSQKTKVLTIYHDNPEITEEHHSRTSICITIPDDAVAEIESGEDDIGTMLIPSGKYAIGHFEIFQDEYGLAWDYLWGEWLSQSGYLPRDGANFEVYLSEPDPDPKKKHRVDIYMPIGSLV